MAKSASKPEVDVEFEKLYGECNDTEKRFINYYRTHPNKSKAAIAAGMSEHSAGSLGWQVYNRPHVFAVIEYVMRKETLTADAVVKMVSDIAQSNAMDYYSKVLIPHTPKIKSPLNDVITGLRLKIQMEKEFSFSREFTKDEEAIIDSNIRMMENQIIRYEIELKHNPLAFRIVDGPTDLVEELRIDLKKVKEDKLKGRVKKVKHTKDGVELEFYSAADAQDRLLRIEGKFEKDNKRNIIVNKPVIIDWGDEKPASDAEPTNPE